MIYGGLLVVIGALLFESTECAIVQWNTNGDTVRMSSVTMPDCYSVAEYDTVGFTVTASTDSIFVTYAIQVQPVGYIFTVGKSTGEVSLINGILDHETNPTIVVIIRATDDTPVPGDLTCTITVLDVNEAAPDFALTSGCLNFDYTLAAYSYITTMFATDADITQTITYTITGGNNGSAFALDAATGIVRVGETTLTTASHILVITATDDVAPMMTATTTLTVNINTPCCSSAAMIAASDLAAVVFLLIVLS